MGFQDIINKIKSDAQKEAELIIKEAELKKEEALNSAKKQIESEKKRLMEKADKEAEQKKRSIIQKAKLESRKKILEAKQNLIEEVMHFAKQKMLNMDKTEFINFYTELILGVVKTGDEEVFIGNESFDEKTGEQLVKAVNEKLKKNGQKGNVKFSGKTTEGKWGVIIQRNKTRINLTLDSLFQTTRNTIEVKLANLLFSKR